MRPLRPTPPATLTGKHRALDEAAAQLVAAWDEDIDARTPAEGIEALERLRTPTAHSSSFPPAPKTPTLPAIPSYPVARNSRSPWPWVAAAVVALAAGAWLLTESGPSAPSAAEVTPTPASDEVAVVPSEGTAPAANSAPAPAPTPVVEPIPARFSLTVRTIPPGATLEVDGQKVSNPYQGEHTADGTVRVVADSERHGQAVRELTLTEDTHLMVTLEPDETEVAAGARASKRQRVRKAQSRKRRRAKAARRARTRSGNDDRRTPAKRKGSSAAGFVSSNPYD